MFKAGQVDANTAMELLSSMETGDSKPTKPQGIPEPTGTSEPKEPKPSGRKRPASPCSDDDDDDDEHDSKSKGSADTL